KVRAEMAGYLPRFRVRGVVTFSGEVMGDSLLFIQDETRGCLVRLRKGTPRDWVRAGSLVEGTGTTTKTNATLEFADNGSANLGEENMPQPMKYPFEPAAADRQAGQWIETEGVGRSVSPGGTLLVMTRTGILPVRAATAPAARLQDCVNALVRVRG